MQSTRFPIAVPELLGAGLRLRELVEDDIPSWFDRATDVESADLAGDPVPGSIDEGASWLERQRDRFRNKRCIRWAIVPAGSPVSVGTVGLSFRSDDRSTAALSIVVARRHWRTGLGTSAVSLASRYAFNEIGVTEIHAEVLQRNPASIGLLEKSGFRRIRVNAPTADEPEELVVYALSAPAPSAA